MGGGKSDVNYQTLLPPPNLGNRVGLKRKQKTEEFRAVEGLRSKISGLVAAWLKWEVLHLDGIRTRRWPRVFSSGASLQLRTMVRPWTWLFLYNRTRISVEASPRALGCSQRQSSRGFSKQNLTGSDSHSGIWEWLVFKFHGRGPGLLSIYSHLLLILNHASQS